MSTYLLWALGAVAIYIVWLKLFGNLGFWQKLAKHPEVALGFIQLDPSWKAGIGLPHPGEGWQGPFKLAARGQVYNLYYLRSDPQAQARVLERIRLIHNG